MDVFCKTVRAGPKADNIHMRVVWAVTVGIRAIGSSILRDCALLYVPSVSILSFHQVRSVISLIPKRVSNPSCNNSNRQRR